MSNQSLIYFLENTTYARSGANSYSTNTLSGFFNGINILLGFPDSLDKLPLPALALVPPVISNGQTEAFGNHLQTETFSGFAIHGYAGGSDNHETNLVQKDSMIEDVKSLLEDIEYVTLYEFDGSNLNATDGDVAIENINASSVPPSEEPVAARYQFIVNFDVEYIKKI